MATFGLILIGLTAGILSGLLGIGGATIIIPALVYLYSCTQHLAQGTAIGALLLPVGLLAAIKYWQTGNLNIPLAALIAVGFLLGAYLGAVFAQPIPDLVLRKIFGFFLLVIALQYIFWS